MPMSGRGARSAVANVGNSTCSSAIGGVCLRLIAFRLGQTQPYSSGAHSIEKLSAEMARCAHRAIHSNCLGRAASPPPASLDADDEPTLDEGMQSP